MSNILTKRRDELIVAIYNSEPGYCMASIARDFGISRERVRQILLRYKAIHNCANCFHQIDSFCACRDLVDVITTANKCTDWTPRRSS